MKGRIVVAFLLVVLASAAVASLGGLLAGEQRSSCCSDRAVLLKGLYSAHYQLVEGNPSDAKRILEQTARAVGEDE